MKNLLLTLILLLQFCLPVFATDYSKAENWVINSKDKLGTDYDVFYIYPTLFRTETEALFDWYNPEYNKKAKDFTTAQTSIFDSKKTRVFAPFVRQVDFDSAIKTVEDIKKEDFDYKKTSGKYGVEDTIEAFEYYLKHYNNGRPYILLGHSQGAMDLLYTLKEIDVKDNFLVAYLIGCPNSTYKNLTFKNIKPAQSENDLGVIAVWNSQNYDANNILFSTKDGYVINPLNWKTTDKKASRLLNVTSDIYNVSTNTFKTKHFVTGAKIDKQNGVLLVDLKSNSNYDNYGLMGEGVFHTSDVWVFSDAIRKNANTRYKKYNNSRLVTNSLLKFITNF